MSHDPSPRSRVPRLGLFSPPGVPGPVPRRPVVVPGPSAKSAPVVRRYGCPRRSMRRSFRARAAGTLGACGRRVFEFLWAPFTAFRLAGVAVQFHFSYILYPVGTLLWLGWHQSGRRGVHSAAEVLVLIWLSLLLHEYGHVVVARRFGWACRRVIFWPGGAVALLEIVPRKLEEFWMAAAGPAASFALAGLFAATRWGLGTWLEATHNSFLRHHYWLHEVFLPLRLGVMANLMIGTVNLCPIFPSDGGRLLRSSLALVFRAFHPATPRGRARALNQATRVAVRWVAPICALGAAIACFHYLDGWTAWLELFVLIVLIGAGEMEYRSLLTIDDEPGAIPATRRSYPRDTRDG